MKKIKVLFGVFATVYFLFPTLVNLSCIGAGCFPLVLFLWPSDHLMNSLIGNIPEFWSMEIIFAVNSFLIYIIPVLFKTFIDFADKESKKL